MTTCTCIQCSRTNAEVSRMVELANGVILCGDCVDEIQAFLVETAAGEERALVAEKSKTPKGIVSFLDDYVVGQEAAKKTIALAVYNHYKRLNNTTQVEIAKSNILLLGPTGTGKTLLAQTVARLLDVPFTIADATSLTQAGYVGDDVETILQRLVQDADGDIEKAQRGIVFLDEVDKIAAAQSGPSISRDVSGEGVQQALLKLIEGTRVSVPVAGNRKHPGAQADCIDTTNILFICSGAFVKLLASLDAPQEARGVGFCASAPVARPRGKVTPELLCAHGMIPEFVGRLPVIATLQPLSVEALERILVEPKNAIVRQMDALFSMDGATLEFKEGAARAIAEKAFAQKTGARGARAILEALLEDALYEVPGTKGARVTVSAGLAVAVEYPDIVESEDTAVRPFALAA